MSSVWPSQHRIRALSLAVFMALAVPMTVSAAQSSQSYDFNTEEFQDKWDMSIDLEFPQISFFDMPVVQNFYGVTEYVKSGPSIYLENYINDERIEFNQNADIDIDVRLSAKFNVPITENGDWKLFPPLEGESSVWTLAPSYFYLVRTDAVTNVIGLNTLAGYIQNDGEINLSSQIHSQLSAETHMYLTTDNVKPTYIEDSYTWEIHPTIESTAYVYADLSLVGMRAQDYLTFGSAAVNNGEITISGLVDRKETTSSYFDDQIGSFEMNFDNDHVLKVDTAGTVEAHTQWYGSGLAIGLLGFSSTAPVSLINNGSIEITTSEEYTAAAFAASADNVGAVYVSNRGDIDLSGAGTRFKHELYANLSGNGRVVMDDWLLSLDYLNQFVPFAIVVNSERSAEANAKLSFAPQSTLYLKPTESQQLDTDLNLGTLIGTYTDSQTISSDLTHVEGFFSSIEGASHMLDLKWSGADANHLTARLTVNPEKSLGHGSRFMALTSDLNALMTLQALTAPTIKLSEAEGPKVTLKPWYYSLNDRSDLGFNSDGGGLVVSTETQKDGYRFAGYWAVAKESSESDNDFINADGSRYALGLALNYFINDTLSLGLRADIGKNRSDWDFKEKFGSDSETVDSQYLYTEAHTTLSYSITDSQALSATAAVCYLRQKQDGFDVTTLSTGRVSYDEGKSDSFLLKLGAQWDMDKEIDGYQVSTSAGLNTVYLTDSQFDTTFTYLDRRFKAKGEMTDWMSTLGVSAGFTKDRVSLEFAGGYSVGRDLSSLRLNARLSYQF